jgi:hypothetical protein
MKHIFTSGGGRLQEIEGPMTPKCTPTLGVALMRESWIFKTLVEKVNKHQIGPSEYHQKDFEVYMPKCPCIVKMHELWSKEESRIKFE